MKNRYDIQYLRSNERHPSRIDLTDNLTKEKTSLHAERSIGSGSYGNVRLFSNRDRQLAVKSNICQGTIEIDDEIKQTKNEYRLMKKVYPDEFYKLATFMNSDKEDLFSFRMVMPVIPGETLVDVNKHIKHKYELARLLLRIMLELERIHSLGVFHGDIKADNILYRSDHYNFDLRFIDFGLAYQVDDSPYLNESFAHYIAPERYKNPSVKAHPSQDIYSLAYLIRNYILAKYDPEWRLDCPQPYLSEWVLSFLKKYPSIDKLITDGVSDKSHKRPCLTKTIEALISDLLPYKHSHNIKKYILAVFKRDNEMMAKYSVKLKKENIHEILEQLIKSNFYTEASFILEFRDDLFEYMQDQLYSFIKRAFSDKDLPLYLFQQILDLIPTSILGYILFKENQNGINPLHRLVKNERRDLLGIIYGRLSWCNVVSLDNIEQVIQSSSIDELMTVIDLSKYIYKQESRNDDYFFKIQATEKKYATAYDLYGLLKDNKNSHPVNMDNINESPHLKQFYERIRP